MTSSARPQAQDIHDVLRRARLGRALGSGAALIAAAFTCDAQDLEPRIYSPNPTGTQFVGVAYLRSTGGVLIDPTLPIEDVDAEINAAIFGYGRTFALLGRSAIATLGLPYVWADLSGNVGEERRAITRSGPADARLRLGVNLKGGSAMTPEEFMRRTPEPTIGVSLTVVAPSGQYEPRRLVNIGANRWAFKPELGVSWPAGRWSLEAYAGAWFFTANDEFFPDSRREQNALTTFQTHIVYTMRPRTWLAFDATLYRGGRTTINDQRNFDFQSNVRVGLTLSIPAGAHHSFKLTWSDGVATRIGSDFMTLGLAWQYLDVD